MCFTLRMKTRLAALLLLLVFGIAPALMASGKKENNFSVTFHMETVSTDNPKMIFPQTIGGKQRYFRRMPELISKDIAGFSPFPSKVGAGYGIAFQLKSHAKNRFAAITSTSQGNWLLAQVNGRVVDAVLIDRQIDDGMVVIWTGVTQEDIAMFDETLPRIGGGGPAKKN
jgi:hypothetical protein